jgi:hypothetical protein
VRVVAFGGPWREAVRTACDPVFAAAGVGFEWNASGEGDPEAPALLWEADPLLFAARYPDSGIEHAYGDQWPAPCLDYWVYVDPVARTAHLSIEGLPDPADDLPLTGDGVRDGALLASVFAEILGVPSPDRDEAARK